MLTEFEQAVLEKSIDSESLRFVQGDVSAVAVLSREYTGVGFYTKLKPGTIRVIPHHRAFTGGLLGAILNGSVDSGYAIYINDGYVEMIEGFTYSDPWPKKIVTFEFYLVRRTSGLQPRTPKR